MVPLLALLANMAFYLLFLLRGFFPSFSFVILPVSYHDASPDARWYSCCSCYKMQRDLFVFGCLKCMRVFSVLPNSFECFVTLRTMSDIIYTAKFGRSS